MSHYCGCWWPVAATLPRERWAQVTGNDDRPQDLPNEGAASHLLLLLLRSKRAWGAVALILVATAVVPSIAKVPVALVLAAVLLAPLLRSLQGRPREGSPRRPVDPARPVRFDGFQGEPGAKRTRWKHVRCLVEGSDLRISSFWHAGAPKVVSLDGAVLRSITASGPRDVNLKSDRMRIIELEISDAFTLLLAVDSSIEETVQAALRARM